MSPSATAPELAAPFAWSERAGVPFVEVDLPGAGALLSTRHGGVSEGPYESLNLGVLTEDLEPNARENRRRLAAAAGIDPAGVAMGWQVHGATVARIGEPARPNGYLDPAVMPKRDGAATATPGVTPLAMAADCLPLLLSLPRPGGGAVAALHCGWRGLAAGIVAAGVRAVCELAEGRPGEAWAAIGAGAGPCCYEVGPEVLEALHERGHAGEVATGRMLDLSLVARRDLERAGVPAGQVASLGLCTICSPGLFFSHRRDGGVTGRQAGLVWLR